MMKEAQELEKEFVEVYKTSSEKFECKLDNELQQLIGEIFDYKQTNEYLRNLGIDLDKAPLGKLTQDKIKRGHNLLCEIQKVLISED